MPPWPANLRYVRTGCGGCDDRAWHSPLDGWPHPRRPAGKAGSRGGRREARRAQDPEEVANRTKWDEDVARGSQHAAPVPLTEPELDARRAELQRLSRTSLPRRALQYLLGCWACQTFWAAVLIYAVTAGVTAPVAWLFSAAAYSGAAVILAAAHGSPPPIRTAEPPAPAARGAGINDRTALGSCRPHTPRQAGVMLSPVSTLSGY